MWVENKKTFVRKGLNQDVLNEVLATYEIYKDQPNEILDDIRQLDYTTQCAAIFGYLVENVTYREDPIGEQYVQSPGYLIRKSKVGDCKSMSVFIGSCLHCLGIPFVFRFVGFANNGIYSHVYIVANPDTHNQIILDPVERIDGEPVFDYARPYVIKKDVRK